MKVKFIQLFVIVAMIIVNGESYAYKDASSLQGKACYKTRSTEHKIIKKNAEIEWSNNYSMQLYEIKLQKSAYKELCGSAIPYSGRKGAIYKNIRQQAWDEWYPNFTMILFEHERQVKAYELLQSR